ncbi:hypothetical protein HIM_05697 [Hirsutella minnesotensis 3608]|uniref:Amidase domain-containing protein n=1 Tax=Hirsutella minnesotensis 3608 TaxID=1043627 RepID=A0A0F7ZK45_9HYPO|nr:hypothetical protein HIM_05697 [Hirsutella minnesotensis 3608]
MYMSNIPLAKLLACVSVLGGVLAAPTEPDVKIPSLRDITLDQLRAGLDNSCFKSTDLITAYMQRIEEVGGQVNAVTEINPDALQIAQALDEERAQKTLRGPLHGIPILLKNNIATKDKMNNTAGSTLLLGATAPEDSTVAKRLREAGAIILGKSNLSQWANFRGNNLPNGWSAHGGQTIAAYHDRQDPSGSSSGSAVATDLGLAFAAVGTETTGSILDPSQRSGIVGIKPTVGLTSRHLVIPISENLDTVGPMARSVRDAAHLLQVLAGRDDKDKYTLSAPASVPDYAAACRPEAMQGARIGVPNNVLDVLSRFDGAGLDAEVAAYKKALEEMKTAGATIVPVEFAKANELASFPDNDLLQGADFIVNLATYLNQLNPDSSDLRNITQVRERTQKTPAEEFPKFDTAVWDSLMRPEQFNNTDPRFKAQRDGLLEIAGPGCLLGALDQNNLTAVVLPTAMAPFWAAPIGTPVVTVPMGQLPDDTKIEKLTGDLVKRGPGVPFGLSFLGRHWSEADLIGLAFAFEQATKVRQQLRPLVTPKRELSDVVQTCPALKA